MENPNRRIGAEEFVDIVMRELAKAHVNIKALDGASFQMKAHGPLTVGAAQSMAQKIASEAKAAVHTEQEPYQPKRLKREDVPTGRRNTGYQIPSAEDLMSDIHKNVIIIHGIMDQIENEQMDDRFLFVLADVNGLLKRNLDMLSVLINTGLDPEMDENAAAFCLTRYVDLADEIDDLMADIFTVD